MESPCFATVTEEILDGWVADNMEQERCLDRESEYGVEQRAEEEKDSDVEGKDERHYMQCGRLTPSRLSHAVYAPQESCEETSKEG